MLRTESQAISPLTDLFRCRMNRHIIRTFNAAFVALQAWHPLLQKYSDSSEERVRPSMMNLGSNPEGARPSLTAVQEKVQSEQAWHF